MDRLAFHPADLRAILVTHEHADHAKGVIALSRRLAVPIYTSLGTSLAIGLPDTPNRVVLCAEAPVSIGDLLIHPVTVPHDAREPLQFVIEYRARKIGVLTDLGSISRQVIAAYSACDALLVEANHDTELLRSGPYPPGLQRRVGGAWGHLNNHQTGELLEALDLSKIQHLVIGHISQKNNDLSKVKECLGVHLGSVDSVTFAYQDEGFSWLELN